MNSPIEPKNQGITPDGWLSRAMRGELVLTLLSIGFGWSQLGIATRGQLGIWWSGIIWIVPVAVPWLALEFELYHVERAAYCHLMLAALTTLAVVPAVEASFRLFLMGLGPIVWPIAILTLAGALVLAWFYISDAVKRLALAEQNNVSCGRLDPANATWNIVAPLFWSLSQQPAHKPRAGIQGLAALAGAISLAILGQLGLLRSPLTWGSFLLLFGLVIFVVAMKSATIGIQLLRWEHKWNRKIHLIA